ncbi:MAG: hypothetical protein PSV23_07770 [Brevundimonas sp.]|uniref:hypothetical protein n=1 Tax=Brevundimonas sp. TaxID=1871086 RepID=UPI002488B6F2|nr:hypothetical protein [Brevundimonas sp.]MDI1326684.1 hypothetical protein [Brevundimonas sp.]
MLDWMTAGAIAVAMMQPQSAPPASAPPVQEPAAQSATILEDVVVEQRRLEEFVQDFVGQVAAPAPRRGLARWQGGICVGVINLRNEAGQYIADRISRVGMDLGLTPGDPGCKPNIVVAFTADGAELASSLVGRNRRAFRMGGSVNRDIVALRAFETSDAPVRWWHVSIPVDSETGDRAIRLPGDVNPSTGQPSAPVISVFAASRLNSQIRDDMNKVMIIVDVDGMAATNLNQLADYLTFVALAQVDPDAQTAGYDTILNVFNAPQSVDGLTEWDMSYLSSLYRVQDAPQRRVNPAAQATSMASDMIRDRRAAQTAGEQPAPRE